MRVSAAGNMPLQGLVKPPAKPVVMIDSFRHDFVASPPSKREAFGMRFRKKTNRIFNE